MGNRLVAALACERQIWECRWFNKDVDKCFVATAVTAERATNMGLDDRQIVVHGLPIRPAFARKPASRTALRSKLGAACLRPARSCLVCGARADSPLREGI